MDSGKGHLERFSGDSVAGGQRERLPGTILRGYRGRWAAGKATWNDFAGIPWQVDGGKGYLERFRENSVAGERRGDATWSAFAGIPWQVEDRERTPGTLLQGFRARWAAGWDTWHSHSRSKITVSVTESLTAGSHGAKGLLWFLPPVPRCEINERMDKR